MPRSYIITFSPYVDILLGFVVLFHKQENRREELRNLTKVTQIGRAWDLKTDHDSFPRPFTILLNKS